MLSSIYDIADYAFGFAGGTLQNTVADIGNSKAQLTRLFLSADTAMTFANSAGFIGSGYAATTLDLAGRTFAVDIASGKSFWLYKGSELKIWGQSTIRISGQPLGGSDTYRLTWGEGDVYALYKNGAEVATGTSGRTPARSMELWVFKANSSSAQYAKMRLYYLKLGEGATIRRDYVPAQRISDGKTGLLDMAHFGKATASDPEFYPDANGGEFTMGSATNYLYVGAARGELHLDVPSGRVVNADVAFTGSLKFVKEGEGTFRARKQGQTYYGGTEVKGGLLEFDNVKSASGSYGTYTADKQLLGAGGSTLAIDADAKLNVAGTFGLRFYNFALNGGTLANENLDDQVLLLDNTSASPNPGFGAVTLTDDSTLLALRQFVFENGQVDLGGKTLTIDFSDYGNKYVFLRGGQTFVNGTICVQGGSPSQFGQIYVDAADLDMRTVNFDMLKAEFNLSKSLNVKDYIARAPLGTGTADNTGTGALNVYGTFKPFNTFFYGCTLQSGATLDLSEQTGAWDTTSTGACPTKTVKFAKDATITDDAAVRPSRRISSARKLSETPVRASGIRRGSAPEWASLRSHACCG